MYGIETIIKLNQPKRASAKPPVLVPTSTAKPKGAPRPK